MQVKIEKKELVIRIPINSNPLPESKSGKTLIVAQSEHHEKTDAVVNGKQVSIVLTAYVYKEDKKPT